MTEGSSMPTYSYTCRKCSAEFNWRKRMTDPPPTRCPHCGSRKIHRLFTPPNVLSVGGTRKDNQAVNAKLQPTGMMNGHPYYGPHAGGLYALSFVSGPDGPRFV